MSTAPDPHSETARAYPSIAVLEVGKPYPFGTPPYPETGEFNYTAAGYSLRLFVKAPRSFEVQAVRNAPAEFAIAVVGRAICVLYRFANGKKGIPWSVSLFSYHLVPPELQALPDQPASDEERALLRVELVDAETGILRALRVLTLSPRVTKVLDHAIREQARQPWCGKRQYLLEVAAIDAEYALQELLARATARDFGGQ
jgi:hypothetical protein